MDADSCDIINLINIKKNKKKKNNKIYLAKLIYVVLNANILEHLSY